MLVTTDDLPRLTGVTKNTIRKSSIQKKEELLYKAGYTLEYSYRQNKVTYYSLSTEDQYIKLCQILKEYGITTRNPRALINCLSVWFLGEFVSVKQLARDNGVTPQSVYRWKDQLAEANIIHVETKALKTKITPPKDAEICTEKEWGTYIAEFNDLLALGVAPQDAVRVLYQKTGSLFRRADKVSGNGLTKELLELYY